MIKISMGFACESQARTFHPETWPRTRNLDHAATNVTAIEAIVTFYRAQTPATLATCANPCRMASPLP